MTNAERRAVRANTISACGMVLGLIGSLRDQAETEGDDAMSDRLDDLYGEIERLRTAAVLADRDTTAYEQGEEVDPEHDQAMN